jgi:hypothetical protein
VRERRWWNSPGFGRGQTFPVFLQTCLVKLLPRHRSGAHSGRGDRGSLSSPRRPLSGAHRRLNRRPQLKGQLTFCHQFPVSTPSDALALSRPRRRWPCLPKSLKPTKLAPLPVRAAFTNRGSSSGLSPAHRTAHSWGDRTFVNYRTRHRAPGIIGEGQSATTLSVSVSGSHHRCAGQYGPGTAIRR